MLLRFTLSVPERFALSLNFQLGIRLNMRTWAYSRVGFDLRNADYASVGSNQTPRW